MIFKLFKFIRKEGFSKIGPRIKCELFKFFNNLQQILSKKYVLSRYGIMFKKNWKDQTFRFYINASYGYFFWNFLSDISYNFVFIDIGTNQGLYTICAAKNKFCTEVYSFEPINSTFSLLAKNVFINKVSKKCRLLKKAVSDQTGTLDLSIKDNHSGAATIRLGCRAEGYIKKEKIETVDQIVLNNLINNNKIFPIVLKIDVEGHEETVINTLIKSNFFKRVKIIFYEVDEDWVNPKKLEDLLKKNGFTKFLKKGNGSHYDVLANR